MNSIGKVLSNFEWECDSTLGFAFGTGYQGKGISRTMFLKPKLEEIPEQLFAVKVSQSKEAAKAGKIVFKWFSFRFDPNAKYESMAPAGVTLETPLADIKALVVSKMGNIPQAEVSLNIKLNGKFTNIACADGVYAIYDEEKFPNPDPNRNGRAPYYVRNEAIIHVKLKGAESQGNEYLQSTLSTTAVSNDIFVKTETGKVWGADDQGATPNPAPSAGVDGAASTAVW